MRQVVIYPDMEDGGWVCEVPSLPGCVSQGGSKEEAIRNVQDAISVWEDAAIEVGIDVPAETFDVQVCVVP
jgi:predicted RNase H-like HicB family nuclease